VTPITVGDRITPSPIPTQPAQVSPPPTPAISTAPSSRGTDRWSANAIWEPGTAASSPLWQTYCGVASAAKYNPGDSGFDCVVEVMRAAGADPEAIEFLQEYGYFLGSFEELGTVDFGCGQAPWFNMGRPQQVLLLNGVPASVELNDRLQLQYEQVRHGSGQANASYGSLMAQQPTPPLAWADRSLLASSEPRNGGQAIVVNLVMQTCRACPIAGYMPVEFIVSPGGVVSQSSTLLPLRMP
jgi:hypothetical protein